MWQRRPLRRALLHHTDHLRGGVPQRHAVHRGLRADDGRTHGDRNAAPTGTAGFRARPGLYRGAIYRCGSELLRAQPPRHRDSSGGANTVSDGNADGDAASDRHRHTASHLNRNEDSDGDGNAHAFGDTHVNSDATNGRRRRLHDDERSAGDGAITITLGCGGDLRLLPGKRPRTQATPRTQMTRTCSSTSGIWAWRWCR